MGYRTYTCPIAKSCGGCEWLAVPYPIQLKRKQAAVEALFADVVSADHARLLPIVGMAEPVAYRHKAATPFAPGTHGRIRSGFYASGTHRIVPCARCLVEAPLCRETLNAVARAAEDLNVPAYDEDAGKGLLRHAIVRAGWKTDDLLLTIVTNGQALRHAESFLKALAGLAPHVTGIVQNVNQRRTNAMLGPESSPLSGPGTMHDQLLGCTFEIGPTSFYQTNPEQTEPLYRAAIDGLRLEPGMRLLDAYCGIGSIGICAARATPGVEVVGVEKGRDAVACARRNAEANGLAGRARFVAADATAYMRDAKKAGAGYDAVVLDPPRTGSTVTFLDGVCSLAPARVAYVSCNPETQARDVALLRRGGYVLDSLQAVDLFPHTRHVESVAILSRP
ncbi:MAG: 23S rRNA (uracil(1939)-C(5))-methyltransferase RlmD [Atopobiaceae bacterium]|jgi:23S rRNA (uracil-5-)-methyltransferase RumA|nr:23S rRNA (uracil(1939)-C(5))-methyltransferase RlmD [Atopobiaceae bacterium]